MNTFLKVWFIITATLLFTAGLFVVLFFVLGMRAPWIGLVSGVLTMVFMQTTTFMVFRSRA